MTSLILEHWNCRDVAELVAEVYQNQEKSHIASLAQLVECAGRMEDEAALHILKKNAMQLAELVKDVAGQLRGDTEEIPLFLFGGLLINDTLLRQFLLEILEKEAGFLKRRVPISDAVGGAVYLALEHLKRQM